MKHTFKVLLFSALIASTGHAEKVRVTADNVNVRASSNLTSRVMGQVSRDTILEAVTADDAWLGIYPPEGIFAWIHSNLVSNNKVTSQQANIRSGPGVNYDVVVSVTQGTALITHEKFSEWVQVTPPEGTLLWISKQYTEPVSNKAEQPLTTSPSKPAIATAPVGVAAKPPKPLPLSDPDDAAFSSATTPKVSPALSLSSSGITSNMLVDALDQGVQVSLTGILKKASITWRRPSRYILVNPALTDSDKALCYVSGNDPQLESMLGREITVDGKQYSIQGARFPLVIASKITVH